MIDLISRHKDIKEPGDMITGADLILNEKNKYR